MPRQCPACGAHRTSGTRVVDGKQAMGGGPLELTSCADCGATFQPRVPTADELARWYDYMGRIPANARSTSLIERRLARIVATFEPVRRTGRLLEVGCGGGLFVRGATAAGWEVWGTEISPSCATLLRPLMGERLFEGPLEAAPFVAGSFDGATMIEVIEHLADPVDYLKSVARLLRPGGRLMLTTPNARGAAGRVLGARWRAFADEHLNYFDRRSIEALLARADFEVEQVATSNLDLLVLLWQMRPRLRLATAPRVARTIEAAAPETPQQPTASLEQAATGALRALIADAAIETINRVADSAGLGDTLKVIARRR